MQFDHIGIVVAELPIGRQILRDHFLVTSWTKTFSDPVNDVHVQFGRAATGPCYELVAPISPHSPVQRALRTGNNITNHVAYLVSDLSAARDRLTAADFVAISDPKPAVAYGGSAIQFFMSPICSVVELIEAPGHQHRSRQFTARRRSPDYAPGFPIRRLHADRCRLCPAGRHISRRI